MAKALPIYTLEEVSKHDKEDDCWVIIENKVYNVTNWLPKHPGGSSLILNLGGRDCTDEFKTFHLTPNYKRIKPFLIGKLIDCECKERTLLAKDVAALQEELKMKGAFETDCKYFLNFL